jgi:hypothetical protein
MAALTESFKERGLVWGIGFAIFFIVIIISVAAWYVSLEPDQFDVKTEALKKAKKTTVRQLPVGYAYASSLAHIAETLLNKPGGYLTNDISPPGILIDNMANWEFGALVMLRDGASALRNHFSRSQSQSSEDPDLARAEPYFYYENNSWALPSTEAEYQKGLDALHRYLKRLGNRREKNPGQFYARADNLRQYLEVVEKRLGGLSARLSASTSRVRKGDNLSQRNLSAGQTAWLDIDDVFYEARGAAWALVHILKAIEHDFKDILINKHALETMQRVIRELEHGLAPTWSPMILNGDGFGIFSNYSLTMANYITRANAATLDLRDIMMRG